MPEETTLTHVATTLQFCLEQLELCEAHIFKQGLLGFGVERDVINARFYTERAKEKLDLILGIEGEVTSQAEGSPA